MKIVACMCKTIAYLMGLYLVVTPVLGKEIDILKTTLYAISLSSQALQTQLANADAKMFIIQLHQVSSLLCQMFRIQNSQNCSYHGWQCHPKCYHYNMVSPSRRLKLSETHLESCRAWIATKARQKGKGVKEKLPLRLPKIRARVLDRHKRLYLGCTERHLYAIYTTSSKHR